MHKPLVSILIPCHNAERWIGARIERALAQTYERTEVIVIDDGSIDDSKDVIQSFEGRVIFRVQENAGANISRNRLLSMSSGDWVQYLDADDYLMPEKIAEQVEVVRQYPDADVLYGPVTVEWQGSSPPLYTWDPSPPPHDTYSLLALWRLAQTGAPIWRRSALEDVGGFREDQPCCQEHELFLRLLIAGKKFIYHPSARGAVYRRFDDGTLSTRNPTLVRTERSKILHRLAEHLRLRGELTEERQWAIDQGFFDMARESWNEDRAEARQYYAAISGKVFRPRGKTAPPA